MQILFAERYHTDNPTCGELLMAVTISVNRSNKSLLENLNSRFNIFLNHSADVTADILMQAEEEL